MIERRDVIGKIALRPIRLKQRHCFPALRQLPSEQLDVGKVQKAVEQQKNIEADFMGQNFGLTNAKRDLVVDGVAIPAGTPYRAASAMVFDAKKKAAEIAGAMQDGDNE